MLRMIPVGWVLWLSLLMVTTSCFRPDPYVEEIRRRADAGDPMAQYDLGVMYYYGNWVKQDYEEAFRWFMNSAEKGYAVAQHSVSICYFQGDGTCQDFAKAVQYMRMSAEQGYCKAMLCYGCLLSEGVGVKKDRNEAMRLFEKASGYNALAMFFLGKLFLEEMDGGADKSKALFWMRRAAYYGVPEAQFELGMWYSEGKLLNRNREQAGRWFRKASAQGLQPAIQRESQVDRFLLTLTQKQEPVTDKTYLLRLPEEKDLGVESVALYQQGFKALFGIDGEQNNTVAINSLMLSTLKGNKSAKILLAYCYATGTATLKSPDSAVFLFVGKGRIQYSDFGGQNTIDFEIFPDGTFSKDMAWKKTE